MGLAHRAAAQGTYTFVQTYMQILKGLSGDGAALTRVATRCATWGCDKNLSVTSQIIFNKMKTQMRNGNWNESSTRMGKGWKCQSLNMINSDGIDVGFDFSVGSILLFISRRSQCCEMRQLFWLMPKKSRVSVIWCWPSPKPCTRDPQERSQGFHSICWLISDTNAATPQWLRADAGNLWSVICESENSSRECIECVPRLHLQRRHYHGNGWKGRSNWRWVGVCGQLFIGLACVTGADVIGRWSVAQRTEAYNHWSCGSAQISSIASVPYYYPCTEINRAVAYFLKSNS